MTAMTDLSGTELGRYRLLQLLGAGGMGAVYEALDIPLGRHVALKILPPELVADERRVRRFAQEARTASALNHPHLIAVYDIGANFIAMEKIDGSTLRELTAAGPLPLERALELTLQIADAVAAAHGAGVIHRDLKPDNVMVSRDGYAKVLDFGLAKLTDETPSGPDTPTAFVSTTQTGFLLGTPGYMSPEQAQGRPADHRADIFSLGCILYELVTGRRAFRGNTPVETLHRIVHEEPEPIAGAPAELQRIVRKCLAKDPNARYQSARDLSIDVRALLRAQHAGTRAPGKLVPVAIAIVVVVAAAAVFIALRVRRTTAPIVPQLHRLTSAGDVITASISPDGKLLAYVHSNEAGQSLWLRQLATQQDLQLVPPARVGFWGHAFTPDGNAVVFGQKGRAIRAGSFFRVSTLGGTPEHLLDGIDSPPSFSPDGTRMTYTRADFPKVGESALMIAASDGSGARPLATRRYPDVFAPVFFGGPSWSPDGKTIVTAVMRTGQAKGTDLWAFDVRSGAGRPLTDGAWYVLGQAAWLPDMSGIVVTGDRETDVPPSQRLWFVPYPSGRPRPVTNDLLSYRMPTISADGRSLVAVGANVDAQLWTVPLTPGAPPRKISHNRVALKGVSYAPDGRIVFVCPNEEHQDLWIANADGSQQMQLTHSRYGAMFPSAFRGGIAYLGTSLDGTELRVTGFDRGSDRVVLRGADWTSIAASPDGQWIAYSVNRRLWKVRADGRGATQLFDLPVDAMAFSPDGTRMAVFFDDRGTLKVGVLSAAGGAATWSMPLDYRTTPGGLHWTPDGNALLTDDYALDRRNIWKITFDGRTEKLTELEGEEAYMFDIAPDGKSLAVARGRLTRDAILINNFH
ncbi:MAG TPA: protein kinase [Thermoanaerobaculia bacterium]|nr:protein kinase [Thermoanaerobaculia bacterium]